MGKRQKQEARGRRQEGGGRRQEARDCRPNPLLAFSLLAFSLLTILFARPPVLPSVLSYLLFFDACPPLDL
jgi:hypothetical protein